jgi:hypothetical protein
MTRLNLELNGPDRAINFAQGFPDFPTDPRIVERQPRHARFQSVRAWGAPQPAGDVSRNSRGMGRDVGPEPRSLCRAERRRR